MFKHTLLLLLVLWPVFSDAGWVVSGSLLDKGATGKLTQSYDGQNLRIDYPQSPGSEQRNQVLYQGKSGLIRIVDTAKKSYLELQEGDLSRLGALIAAFPRKGAEPPLKAKDIQFVKGGKEQVGTWNCTRYTVKARGKVSGSLCVVPFTALGASAADFKALERLARSFTTLAPLAPEHGAYLTWGLDKALGLGFLVQAVAVDAQGKTVSELKIDSAKKQPVAAKELLPPEGYARNDLSMLLQNMVLKNRLSGK